MVPGAVWDTRALWDALPSSCLDESVVLRAVWDARAPCCLGVCPVAWTNLYSGGCVESVGQSVVLGVVLIADLPCCLG